MKKFIFALILTLSVISCQNELVLNSEINLSEESRNDNGHAISIDQALANLEAFLAETESTGTRTVKPRTVSSIAPIKYNSITTRAESDHLECDNLLYIANFEDEQGYAILAADERIEEKVIAVADDGYLSDATVYTAVELANSERIIIDDYPTTGAGFFTTPETGDELFINPNTVSLYDESMNDTFVGDFGFDDIGAEDEKGNPVETNPYNVELASTPELVTSSLCVSYALNEIRECERMQIQDDRIVGDGSDSSSPRTVTSTSAWKVNQCVSPILSNFVDWNQGSPFNDLYPRRRKFLICGNRRNAPAGCFPLAIAKILTHFEFPSRFTYNGYTVNWTELKSSFETTVGELSAAHLLRGISSGCGSLYFYEGTFTFPKNATSYMRSIGFNNAHSYSYSFDRVKGMIDKGCPLVIYSVPGINIFKSHSWNIDGYKIKERTVTTNTYKGNTLQDTTTKTETCKMVHCDFGWRNRKCNGYYVSGVFKLNDSNIEHDPGSSYGGDTNYNNLLKVITYDKP